MEEDTHGADALILLCLSGFAVPLGVLISVIYWLFQPTIIPNTGLMMTGKHSNLTRGSSAELADQHRMERSAVETAAEANGAEVAEVLIAHPASEPRVTPMQREAKAIRAKPGSRRP